MRPWRAQRRPGPRGDAARRRPDRPGLRAPPGRGGQRRDGRGVAPGSRPSATRYAGRDAASAPRATAQRAPIAGGALASRAGHVATAGPQRGSARAPTRSRAAWARRECHASTASRADHCRAGDGHGDDPDRRSRYRSEAHGALTRLTGHRGRNLPVASDHDEPVKEDSHAMNASRERVPVHLRVGHRGPPRQDRRPDLRRRARRGPARRPQRPGGLRDPGQHGPGGRLRRDHHRDLRRHPGHRPHDDRQDRLHRRRLRLRLQDVRGHQRDRQAVARHRPGRRRAL